MNQSVQFTEDLSRLTPPVDPNAYKWNWDFGDGATGSGYTASHTYAKVGNYDVRVSLVDPQNPENSADNFDSAQIHVVAQSFTNPPIAVIHASAQYAQIGASISFDASGSKSQVGGKLTYNWNFNDTQLATGESVTHVFSILGQAFVAVIVEDDRGAKALATAPIYVATELPVANLSVSATTARPGATVNFDASGSTAPKSYGPDSLVSYSWNFGDGVTAKTTVPTTTHAYAHTGNYTVTLLAFDKQNLPGQVQVVIHVNSGNSFALGPFAGAFGIILVLFALGIIGNWMREREAERQRQALARARHARRRR